MSNLTNAIEGDFLRDFSDLFTLQRRGMLTKKPGDCCTNPRISLYATSTYPVYRCDSYGKFFEKTKT